MSSYLLKSEYFDGVAKELELATLCVDYLNLPIFDGRPFSAPAVLDGSYGFMEYAILNWIRHLEAGLPANTEPNDLTRGFLESFEGLLEKHWNSPTTCTKISKSTRDKLQSFRSSMKYSEVEKAVASTQQQMKRFDTMRSSECALDLSQVVAHVRVEIESVIDKSTDGTGGMEEVDIKLKYGTNLFKCLRFSCKYFTYGFPSRVERDAHEKRHERPFRCTDIHCTGFIGFAEREQLARHLKDIHTDLADQEYAFPTEEEVAESLKEHEPETDEELEDAEGSGDEHQVIAEQHTEAEISPVLVSRLDNRNQQPQSSRPHKRTKTQTEFKCPHCEKTFNKRWNHDSHLKTHGVGETLSCQNCGTQFVRSSDLRRHMQTHTNAKLFKCGGVLQSGQHWGCGASFMRRDILSNHYKSKKGKKCIGPIEGGDLSRVASYSMPEVGDI